jgi:hypothetical protein
MPTWEEISGRGTPIYTDLLDFYGDVHTLIRSPCGQGPTYEPHISTEIDTNLKLEVPLSEGLKSSAQDVLAISQARFDWAFDSAQEPPENMIEEYPKKVLYGMMLYKVQETLPSLKQKLDETIKLNTYGIARKHNLDELLKLDGVFQDTILYPFSVIPLVGAIKLRNGDYKSIVERCDNSEITYRPVDHLMNCLNINTK